MIATDDRDRLVDENEQLRTALEASLEENAAIGSDRERLLRRVTALARELQAANTAYGHARPVIAPLDAAVQEAVQNQTEEELRVAFEELQVLTEELEVANTSLHEANAHLEARVEERTRELADSNAALRLSESAFRVLIEGMPQLSWRSDSAGTWTWSSPQWSDYTGQTLAESLGQGWMRAIHPDDRAAVAHAWARTEPLRPLEFEARIFHDHERRYRHFRTRAAPVIADGAIVEWLGTSTDVDDILQLQQRQGVLVDELQHRTRNLMAVVQAVTLRTVKGSKTLEDFRRSIDDRMQALARTQGLLSRRGLGKVTFDALLFAEFAAQVDLDEHGNGAQVSTDGPRGIPLPSAIVQTLALALHELLTNAVKYGALVPGGGHLDVQWSLLRGSDASSRLRIVWTERGVAMADAAATAQGGGYGRELIERALPYQLGAQTSYGFGADGVHCTIEVTIAANEPDVGGEA